MCHFFQADYRLHNSDDVLSLLRRCPSGIAASKISDAYPNIMKDIDEMVAAKKVGISVNRIYQHIDIVGDTQL